MVMGGSGKYCWLTAGRLREWRRGDERHAHSGVLRGRGNCSAVHTKRRSSLGDRSISPPAHAAGRAARRLAARAAPRSRSYVRIFRSQFSVTAGASLSPDAPWPTSPLAAPGVRPAAPAGQKISGRRRAPPVRGGAWRGCSCFHADRPVWVMVVNCAIKNAHAVPLASARQHPVNPKENQAASYTTTGTTTELSHV